MQGCPLPKLKIKWTSYDIITLRAPYSHKVHTYMGPESDTRGFIAQEDFSRQALGAAAGPEAKQGNEGDSPMQPTV